MKQEKYFLFLVMILFFSCNKQQEKEEFTGELKLKKTDNLLINALQEARNDARLYEREFGIDCAFRANLEVFLPNSLIYPLSGGRAIVYSEGEYHEVDHTFKTAKIFDISELGEMMNSVAEMKKDLTLKLNDLVVTKGYYQAGDGGYGMYIIGESSGKADDGRFIRLDNGLQARLIVNDKAVTIRQYGARGDGLNDDTRAIQSALNSGFENIYMTAGDYKACDVLYLTTDHTSLYGIRSVLFTDNDFRKNSTAREFFFRVEGRRNPDNSWKETLRDVKVSGLRFEAREQIKTSGDSKYKTQFLLLNVSNVKVLFCEFDIPDIFSSSISPSERFKVARNNMDLYGKWNSVEIRKCRMNLMTDTKNGLCIQFRIIGTNNFGNCGDAVFAENICRTNSHDEMLAVFGQDANSTIRNVKITKNKFYSEETVVSEPRVMAFSFSINNLTLVKDILFEENEVTAFVGSMCCMFRKSSDIIIRKNSFELTQYGGTDKMRLFHDRINESSNVVVEDNLLSLHIPRDQQQVDCLASYPDGRFSGNTVTIEGDIKSSLFKNGAVYENNTIDISGDVKGVGLNISHVKNNKIRTGGTFTGNLFHHYDHVLDRDVEITGNNFTCVSDVCCLLSVGGKSNLNPYRISFLDNVIIAGAANDEELFLLKTNVSENPLPVIVMQTQNLGKHSRIHTINPVNLIQE